MLRRFLQRHHGPIAIENPGRPITLADFIERLAAVARTQERSARLVLKRQQKFQVGIGPIGRAPIDVSALERAVADPHAGAIVTFAGTTRADNAGRNVIRLEYEAYEPMALNEMRRLAREAGERWQIVRIAISHRVGLVDIGETSVAIAVSAVHRGEAFEACRFAIDRLKEVVPIWKKEYFEGGEVWIGCQTSHPPAPGHAH